MVNRADLLSACYLNIGIVASHILILMIGIHPSGPHSADHQCVCMCMCLALLSSSLYYLIPVPPPSLSYANDILYVSSILKLLSNVSMVFFADMLLDDLLIAENSPIQSEINPPPFSVTSPKFGQSTIRSESLSYVPPASDGRQVTASSGSSRSSNFIPLPSCYLEKSFFEFYS